MPDLQAFGQRADGRMGFAASLECQQQLVLAGLEAGGAGRLLAEMQEAAHLVPEIGEGGKLGSLQGHGDNIS
jgi:hypothetical protein